MATLRDIRRKISSVKSTQQITKAMKMVAAAKLRRAQENILKTRPYAYRLNQVLGHVAGLVDRSIHPLLEEREAKRIGIVAVTADRGLCGAFNQNILRKATEELEAQTKDVKDVFVIAIGRHARDYFRIRPYPVIYESYDFFSHLEFANAVRISEEIIRLFTQHELDHIHLVYNEFKSAIQQNLTVEQLLPIQPVKPDIGRRKLEYLYEPSPDQILDALLPKQIDIQLWRVLLESNAAEQGARMTAMEMATDNASEMIDKLTLYYNRVRQATITKEITEIVGGAEALNK
ncbi:ATP synthase gamma chain [bacterium BMS3Abin05]|nr:ATP synthase gamma chain [bacterium BMS3Abin05]GBE26323.1 ATP synthase gamma chain [bacterium BMS3Bbin03]